MTNDHRRDLKRAVHSFQTWVFDQAAMIDPREEHDWSSLALGYLLGANCLPPFEQGEDDADPQLTVEGWQLIDAMACGDTAKAVAIIDGLL